MLSRQSNSVQWDLKSSMEITSTIMSEEENNHNTFWIRIALLEKNYLSKEDIITQEWILILVDMMTTTSSTITTTSIKQLLLNHVAILHMLQLLLLQQLLPQPRQLPRQLPQQQSLISHTNHLVQLQLYKQHLQPLQQPARLKVSLRIPHLTQFLGSSDPSLTQIQLQLQLLLQQLEE